MVENKAQGIKLLIKSGISFVSYLNWLRGKVEEYWVEEALGGEEGKCR